MNHPTHQLPITSSQVAIDFGISNTDCIAQIKTQHNTEQRCWTQPYDGDPDAEEVRRILAKGGIDLDSLPRLAVTGGRHKVLPDRIGNCTIVKVAELEAIGLGGRALAKLPANQQRKAVLVVSAGSGTAIVAARYNKINHVTGTAVGGGTMLGLSRLLINSVDPHEIETLAQAGRANGVDLSLTDVITGPIGALPADATAVNFGRLARHEITPSRQDLAAGIVNMVAQVIGLLAVNAARAQRIDQIVVIGHLIDMPSIRRTLHLVGHYYQRPIHLPEDAGFGTALGALEKMRG